ncbi:MAG: BatA domain-containing protein [Gemmatimonadales bacterium]
MIGFLHPWVLAGLTAAGLPLLLHLIARREPPTVVFPAVRYLVDATREHQRRLRLQHWLLLLVRTLLVVLLVLAAAGPSAPIRSAGSHSPTALVLVLDNSLSSGAVVSGTSLLSQLVAAARRLLDRSTPEDALWLIAADAVPRRGDRASLGALIDSLGPAPRRLELGMALTLAGEILAQERRPGEIVLLSDLQASAVGPADLRTPLLVGRPAGPPPPTAGIRRLAPGPQPWTPDGGKVVVWLSGDSGTRRPVSLHLGGRAARQALGSSGEPVAFSLPGAAVGWWPLRAELDPDELRADDIRVGAVRISPVARVGWPADERYLAAACEVLAAAGRIRQGEEVTLGRLGPGISVIEPPADPAALGALNRALAGRGIGWRYGTAVLIAGVSDSGPVVGREQVSRRYTIEPSGSGRTGVLATVGGAPWIVRGAGVVLLGSRLDPAWTGLPRSAGFVPFVDAVINRLARGEAATLEAAPGDPVPLPDLITAVRLGDRVWPAEGGAAFRPPVPGVYFLMAGPDTAGILAVNPDPRESILDRASDAGVRKLWTGARLVDLETAGEAAFQGAARADLRGPLLWGALLFGLAEVALASGGRRRA